MIRAFFSGWRRIRFRTDARREVFDLAYRRGIRLWRERTKGDYTEARILSADAARIGEMLADGGTEAEIGEAEGFPAVLRFVRRRPGIAAGFVCAAVFMFWSAGLVWDVRIEGNRNVPADEIEGRLAEMGFEIGTRFGEIDFDRLQADYLAAQNELAWLSVYMDGTVARVQVWEMRPGGDPDPPPGMAANVIAREDGVVEEIRVREGEAALKAGDVIHAGDVAISGVVRKKDGGVRFEYASGEVLVTTVRALSAKIPFERTEMRPTGEEKRVFTVKIFKKTVKLFKNSGFDDGTCDTIDTIGKVCLFGEIPLPLWIGTETIRRTEPVSVTVTPEEAEREARAEIRRLIREEAAGGEIAGKETRICFTESSCRADAVLYVTRDIGETAAFPVDIGKDGEDPDNMP